MRFITLARCLGAIAAVFAAQLAAAQPVTTKWTATDGTLITGTLDSQGHVVSAENTDKKGVKRSVSVQQYPDSAVHYLVDRRPALTLSTQYTSNSTVVQVESRARTMQIAYTFGDAPGGGVRTVVSFPRGGPGENKFVLASSDQVISNLEQNFRIYFPSYQGLVERFNPAFKNYKTLRNTYIGNVGASGSGGGIEPYAGKLGEVFKLLFTGICAASGAGGLVAIPTCMLALYASDQIDAADSGGGSGTPPGGGGGGGTGPASTGSSGDPGGSTDHPPLKTECDKDPNCKKPKQP